MHLQRSLLAQERPRKQGIAVTTPQIMRQKEKKRKSKYPRLRPGEDQLSILPEEPASDSWVGGTGRCPILQVSGTATTAAETSAIRARRTNKTLPENPVTPARSTATKPQATYRTISEGPEGPGAPALSSATPAQSPSSTAERHGRAPAESAATAAQNPDTAPGPSPDTAPGPSPDTAPARSLGTTSSSPKRTAEGKKAPRKGWRRKKTCSSKTVHFASLPDKYEPLEEGVGERESKEEKKYKRKQKAKKYAKNVGKALQTGCRYLLLGFQGLANAYAAPWGVSSAVIGMAR